MTVKKISFLALFVALSAVGGLIKIPAPMASIALDACPALVAAGLLGPAAGALVAAFGHLSSAGVGGFPLGALHVLVALEMAVIVWLFGKLYVMGRKRVAATVFIFLNGAAAPAPFILFFGMPFYVSAVLPLAIAALFNGLLAFVLLPRLAPFINKKAEHLHA